MNVTTNHSGGAIGSDSAWDSIGREFGITNHIHYYHQNKTPLGNTQISEIGYNEGRIESAKAAKLNWGYPYSAMKDSRLIRNWSQVKHSDAIFAIGSIVNIGERVFPNQPTDTRLAITQCVAGGTGYAVGMAINHNKPVFVFDQNREKWYTWRRNRFVECPIPVLTEQFAGIGTREIKQCGLDAIRSIYITWAWDQKILNQAKELEACSY